MNHCVTAAVMVSLLGKCFPPSLSLFGPKRWKSEGTKSRPYSRCTRTTHRTDPTQDIKRKVLTTKEIVIHSSHLEMVRTFYLSLCFIFHQFQVRLVYLSSMSLCKMVRFTMLRLYIFFQTLHFRWKTHSEWVRLGERAILCCSG